MEYKQQIKTCQAKGDQIPEGRMSLLESIANGKLILRPEKIQGGKNFVRKRCEEIVGDRDLGCSINSNRSSSHNGRGVERAGQVLARSFYTWEIEG